MSGCDVNTTAIRTDHRYLVANAPTAYSGGHGFHSRVAGLSAVSVFLMVLLSPQINALIAP
jgi:hypothetical protein